MSNQTTPGNGTWPANQMNATHYLNGTEVPTAAPFITNGTGEFYQKLKIEPKVSADFG